jgi:hypothetical protein
MELGNLTTLECAYDYEREGTGINADFKHTAPAITPQAEDRARSISRNSESLRA